jgi:hypothetical protein
VTAGEQRAVWRELATALGIPVDPSAGERVAATAAGTPSLYGTVEESNDRMVTLVLEEPAPGIGFVGVGGPGDDVYAFVRAQLFGEDAAGIAAREQVAWAQWFAERSLGTPAG